MCVYIDPTTLCIASVIALRVFSKVTWVFRPLEPKSWTDSSARCNSEPRPSSISYQCGTKWTYRCDLGGPHQNFLRAPEATCSRHAPQVSTPDQAFENQELGTLITTCRDDKKGAVAADRCTLLSPLTAGGGTPLATWKRHDDVMLMLPHVAHRSSWLHADANQHRCECGDT